MTTELPNLLLKEYTKILETGEFYDTEILVGEGQNSKVFRLHSFVLKICSPYFRTALSSNWIRIENNIIKFKKPNISTNIFEIIIKYLYSGKLELGDNDIKTNVALLIAADELCLNGICIYIEKYLLINKELLRQNFVLIQDITNKFTQFTKLLQFYDNAFQQDPSLIFKANDFTTIKQEILLDIIVKNDLSLSPIEIWDKLMEWAIYQSNELPSDITKWTEANILIFKNLIQPFVSHINFKGISRADFFKKIKPFKNIFEDKFYIKILEYYSFNNVHVELADTLQPQPSLEVELSNWQPFHTSSPLHPGIARVTRHPSFNNPNGFRTIDPTPLRSTIRPLPIPNPFPNPSSNNPIAMSRPTSTFRGRGRFRPNRY